MPDFVLAEHVDATLHQIKNHILQVLSADPGALAQGRLWYVNTDNTIRYYDGTTIISLGRLNKISPPDGPVTMANQKLTNLGAGTVSSDAVNKGQLDAAIQGVQYKGEVAAASTANINPATPGGTIDGVTLVNPARVLLKDQTTPSQNGIYVWTGPAAAMSRATDADTGTELVAAAVFVTGGTANAGTLWAQQTPSPITLDTTAVTWARIGGNSTSPGAGLVANGVAFDVNVAAAGAGGLEIVADVLQVDRTKVPFKVTGVLGDGALTTIPWSHNLNTSSPDVSVYRVADGVKLYPGVQVIDANTINITASPAPALGSLRAVAVG